MRTGQNRYIGYQPVVRRYIGDTLVWEKEAPPEYELGINFTQDASSLNVPSWNNVRKPNGTQGPGPNMTFTDLSDINEVNRDITLGIIAAVGSSNTTYSGALYPHANVYRAIWYSASNWGVLISGLDDNYNYQFRIVGSQTGNCSYTVNGITQSTMGANFRPTTDNWDDNGYIKFDDVVSTDGEVTINITATNPNSRTILSLQIRAYGPENQLPPLPPELNTNSREVEVGGEAEFTAQPVENVENRWYDSEDNLLHIGDTFNISGLAVGNYSFKVVAFDLTTELESEPVEIYVIVTAVGEVMPPTVSPMSYIISQGDSLLLTGSSNNEIRWYDSEDNLLHTGNTYSPSTSSLGTTSIYVTAYDSNLNNESEPVPVSYTVIEDYPVEDRNTYQELTLNFEGAQIEASVLQEILPFNSMRLFKNTVVNDITPVLPLYKFTPASQSVIMDDDKTITFQVEQQ